MTRPTCRARPTRRRGYIMIEMVVATLLATLLGALLGMACLTFARPAMEVEARARIEQEAILAAQSLACDFGGYLTDPPALPPGAVGGSQADTQAPRGWAGVRTDFRCAGLDPALPPLSNNLPSNSLVLDFRGSGDQNAPFTCPATYKVTYSLHANPADNINYLRRQTVTYQYEDLSAAGPPVPSNLVPVVTTTIAGHVDDFTVWPPDPDNANQIKIQFTISYRNFKGTYTLIGVPSS